MRKLAFLSFLLAIAFTKIYAQISPAENSLLNYRLIGFSYAANERHIIQYKIAIAQGNHITTDSFKRHIIASLTSKNSRTIQEVPFFGKAYTWRVSCTDANGKVTQGILHHFRTREFPKLQNTDTRLLVTTPAKSYANAFVFSDGNKALYNMKGQPIWFMPDIGGISNDKLGIRDLKLSPANTITFLANDVPYEINYDGTVLWTAPKPANDNDWGEGDFHHEFTRLKNGHYMVLGNEMALWNRCKTGTCDSNSLTFTTTKTKTGDPNKQLVPFCTILEYDATGHVLWKWRSSTYLKQSDIFSHEGLEGFANIDAHANAFYFNEKNNRIYLSYKDINRIIVISYPDGKVLAEYGEKFGKGSKAPDHVLFSEQHCTRISKAGLLYMLNNDLDHNNRVPSVVMFKEPKNNIGSLSKVWEAQAFTEPSFYSSGITKLDRHGGSVMELPDGAILVSMCSPYWNMYIINKQKKILWSAIPEKFDAPSQKWLPNNSYRSSIICDARALEKLVFSTNNKPVTAP